MFTEETCSISRIEQLLKEGYEVEVDSPDGYVPVNYYINKGEWEEHVLTIDNDSTPIRVNGAHLFETVNGWKSAKDLVSNPTKFLTKNGFIYGNVVKTGNKIPIVDINVNHANHRYYTENVSSHNTGVGKSLAMCHFAAANMVAGLNVLYITMEMAEERIAERIDANLLDVTLDDLKVLPKSTYDKKMEKLKSKVKGKLVIKEYPTACAGSANFRHLLNELKIKKNFVPDVIYIDYLNICMSSRIKNGANVNSYTLVKAIAEELRGLAVEYNVPIISATQTTRSGYSNSDVGLEDTSESFGLPATADFMFALTTSEELEELGQIMVKQLKNRYNDPSVNRRFVLGVDRSRMRLFDVEPEGQDLTDEDKPVMDKTQFGEQDYERNRKKPKFDKNKFEGFK
jgi:hypothetical protein